MKSMLEPVRNDSDKFDMAGFFYADAGLGSTFRLLTCLFLLLPGLVWADPPKFSTGGFNFQIQYGPGFWNMDQKGLETQLTTTHDPGGAAIFVGDLVNTHTVGLSAAYNIMGHVSLGADFNATGWKLDQDTRGGAGFLAGKIAWHPLELIFMKKEQRPIPLDFNTFFGLGYGIAGGGRINPRGMDGLLFEWGANVDYFFSRFFGLGFFARGVFFNWNKFYLDYNNRDVPGNTITLDKPSGGAFWTFGLALTFRAGE
jgi:hypothetical protein